MAKLKRLLLWGGILLIGGILMLGAAANEMMSSILETNQQTNITEDMLKWTAGLDYARNGARRNRHDAREWISGKRGFRTMILGSERGDQSYQIRLIITVLVKNHRVMEKTERSLCRQKKRGEQ